MDYEHWKDNLLPIQAINIKAKPLSKKEKSIDMVYLEMRKLLETKSETLIGTE